MYHVVTDLFTRKPGHLAPGLRGGGDTRPGIIGSTIAVTGTPGGLPPSSSSSLPPPPPPPLTRSPCSSPPFFALPSLTDCTASSLVEGPSAAVAVVGLLPPPPPSPCLFLALILTAGGECARRRTRRSAGAARSIEGTSMPKPSPPVLSSIHSQWVPHGSDRVSLYDGRTAHGATWLVGGRVSVQRVALAKCLPRSVFFLHCNVRQNGTRRLLDYLSRRGRRWLDRYV